jgi:hypothetical protein
MLLRCERLEPPMSQLGQKRRGQSRPHIDSFPVRLQSGRKFKTLLCVAKCQNRTKAIPSSAYSQSRAEA